MRNEIVTFAVFLGFSHVLGLADTGRIVRIPTPAQVRCINAKTDEITMTLRYVKTQKTAGLLTRDHRAGVTVISTLNSDGNPKAQNPSVNLVGVDEPPAGQVFLPLEYPIASLLPLSPDQGRTYTKNILLEIYLDKVREANSFGNVLDLAGPLLGKLPIPANPYTTAVSEVIGYATLEITKASTDNGGQLLASVTLQFNDRDQNDVGQCKAEDHETTGAIAVIGPKAAQGVTPLPLDNLESDYCWSFVAATTYEVEYAPHPAGDCASVPNTAYKDVPNDYVMILLSAAAIIPTNQSHQLLIEGLRNKNPNSPVLRREHDLNEARKLCDAMKLDRSYCGAQ